MFYSVMNRDRSCDHGHDEDEEFDKLRISKFLKKLLEFYGDTISE